MQTRSRSRGRAVNQSSQQPQPVPVQVPAETSEPVVSCPRSVDYPEGFPIKEWEYYRWYALGLEVVLGGILITLVILSVIPFLILVALPACVCIGMPLLPVPIDLSSWISRKWDLKLDDVHFVYIPKLYRVIGLCALIGIPLYLQSVVHHQFQQAVDSKITAYKNANEHSYNQSEIYRLQLVANQISSCRANQEVQSFEPNCDVRVTQLQENDTLFRLANFHHPSLGLYITWSEQARNAKANLTRWSGIIPEKPSLFEIIFEALPAYANAIKATCDGLPLGWMFLLFATLIVLFELLFRYGPNLQRALPMVTAFWLMGILFLTFGVGLIYLGRPSVQFPDFHKILAEHFHFEDPLGITQPNKIPSFMSALGTGMWNLSWVAAALYGSYWLYQIQGLSCIATIASWIWGLVVKKT